MKDLLQSIEPGTKGNGEFRVDLATPIRVADSSGRIHEVVSLAGKGSWNAPTRIPVNLSHKRVDGIDSAYGSGKLGDRKAEFHWFNGPNGEKAIVTLQEGKEKPQRAELRRTDPSEGAS
jgi:hypothetical protein